MRRGRVGLLLVGVLILGACGVRPRVVVDSGPATGRSASHAAAASQRGQAAEHVVVRGDTLYGIAFRNGLDYRDLARWNGIVAPYTIYPGQRLRLSGGAMAVTSVPPPRQSGSVSRPTVTPAAPTPATPTPAPTPAGATTVTAGGPAPVPATTTRNAASPAATAASGSANPSAAMPATTPVVATSASRTAQGIAWRWPATGQLVARFVAGDQTRQGIGIAGSTGQPVVAAADGEVVYSGSGLIGYGELIIVKHGGDFLSAYGHNRRRLVNEGQVVKAGQQIAEMGRTGASRDMLHFEIRRNGKPVDPLGFLPPR